MTGAACVIVGVFASVTFAAGRQQTLQAASAGSAALLWALARWWIVRRSLRAGSGTVDQAVGWGLVPWLVAFTPELRFAAWAVSATLTWLLLEREGVTRRGALRAVSAAWGAHAAFIVLLVVLQNMAVIALS